MKCRQIQAKIADYSVGLLRARESEQMAAHLAACADCGREWRQLQAVLSLVERCGSREPPPHLWNGVYNRITTEKASAPPSFWERLLGARSRLIAGAATGLAAAAVLVSLHFSGGSTGQLSPVPWPTTASGVAVQQHAMLEGLDPLADEVGLEAYARLVNDPTVNPHGGHQ